MLVVGIDEVGRGCIAGPLVVGVVALDSNIFGLKDSKLLSRSKRSTINKLIILKAAYCATGWASAQEIDVIGLTNSLKLALSRALTKFNHVYDVAYLDGNYNYAKQLIKSETVVKGDSLIPAISAASIIAKVARDNYMIKLDKRLPVYGFCTHVGYCTPKHVDALTKYGPSDYHRLSFEPVKTLTYSKSIFLSPTNRAVSIKPAK